jgi:hypothetical protein
MAVVVRDNVQVETNIFIKSMNMVVNSVMEMLLEITFLRKLDPASLLAIRRRLEDALYIWLHERTLQGLLLEISLPESANALENWEVVFAYSDDPDSSVQRAPTEELKRFGESLKSLPPGTCYRVLAMVSPGARKIQDWEPATLKNINPTIEKDFGNFGYGNIHGQMLYRSGIL